MKCCKQEMAHEINNNKNVWTCEKCGYEATEV